MAIRSNSEVYTIGSTVELRNITLKHGLPNSTVRSKQNACETAVHFMRTPTDRKYRLKAAEEVTRGRVVCEQKRELEQNINKWNNIT